MLHALIALLAAVSIALAATFYLRRIRQPREETEAGIVALSAMSWREFIHLVLAALGRRGYVRVFEHEAARDDSEYILERDGQRWLLTCKHGSAFVLGPLAVNEIADAVRVHGAAGGLLVTQGRIEAAARPIATPQRIELLDGATLWPEVRELMDARQYDAIRAGAAESARKHTTYAWAVAALAGIALFLALPRSETGSVGSGAPPATARAVAPAPASGPALSAPADGTDAQTTLEQQRTDIARAISTLPMVDRAVWSTQSTLQVYLLETTGDAMERLCPLLERNPELAASRIQLTPPSGSAERVRFTQCRAF